MSKLEKILERWKSTKPKEVKKEEVIHILERFGFSLDYKKGSHIVVKHTKLINRENFGQRGEFSVPVKHGRFVKGFYIKTILIAIEIVREDD